MHAGRILAMREKKKVLVAIASLLLSLPAFFAVWAGLAITYLVATIGGY
jgi:hypothetical protein